MTATTQISEAFQAASAEGLAYFWAEKHVGGSVAFVGQSWEDGGFHVDEEGNPTSDVRGNTVAKFEIEKLEATNAAHLSQCEEWYAG